MIQFDLRIFFSTMDWLLPTYQWQLLNSATEWGYEFSVGIGSIAQPRQVGSLYGQPDLFQGANPRGPKWKRRKQKQVDGVPTWGGGKGWMILKITNKNTCWWGFFVRCVFLVDEMPDALTKIVCFNNDDSISYGIDFWSFCFEDKAGWI